MGLFNKTEEELKLQREKEKKKEIRNAIQNKMDDNSVKEELLELLDSDTHPFIDDDIKYEFILHIIDACDLMLKWYVSYDKYYEKVCECLKDLLPRGAETEDFENIKSEVINNFFGKKYIILNIYNNDLRVLIPRFEDLTRVLRAIYEYSDLIDAEAIDKYIRDAAKYSPNYESYIQTILSTLLSLKEAVNAGREEEDFLNEALEKDKEKVGVYSVSYEDLVEANDSCKRIESIMDEADGLLERIQSEKKSFERLVDGKTSVFNGKYERSIKELESLMEKVKNEINDAIIDEKNKLVAKLDKYLEEEENKLSNKGDLVFADLLEKYQAELKEFRILASQYQNQSAQSLINLQNETQKRIDELQAYARNNPQLEKYLEAAEASNTIKERIVELIDKEKENAVRLSEIKDRRETIVEGIPIPVVATDSTISTPKSIYLPEDLTILPSYNCKNEKDYKRILESIEKEMESNTKMGKIYHKATLEIIKCLIAGEWPYLYGPSGAGKGKVIDQIGELLHQEVIKSGKIGEVHTILGYIDAQGRFRATPAFKAFTEGGIIFFDEFDNGNPDTRVAINEMYSPLRDKIDDPSSKQYVKFAYEYDVEINPNTRMIAAGNTDGNGSDENFTDRYPTDESIKQRYTPIYFPYDMDVERKIFGPYKEFCEFFFNFRSACEEYAKSMGMQSVPGTVTTRDAADIREMIEFNGKTVDEVIRQRFVQIKGSEYRNAIASKMCKIYNLNTGSNSNDVTTSLKRVTGKELAKQLIKRCKTGVIDV